jgi:hypothetical protein
MQPLTFLVACASLHGPHDECAPIRRPHSKLRDTRARICSNLRRNVLIDDACKELLEKRLTCIDSYVTSFCRNQ